MTVLDYITEWGRAQSSEPFDSPAQGDLFMLTWCYRCRQNAGFCTLIGVALMGRTPAQWMETSLDVTSPDRYTCGEWVAR